MSREYRLFYPALPAVAEHAPHRVVYVGDADGRCQILAWDRRTDTVTQLTDRATGTIRAALDPDGETVWWFDDDLAGVGVWRTRDFPNSAPDQVTSAVSAPALPGVTPARHAGIAMADDGTALVGLADDDGLTLHRRDPHGRITEVTRTAGYAYLVDLDPTGELAAVGTDPAAADAVTVVGRDGATVGVVSGQPDRRVWALGFAPGGGQPRLLLVLEQDDRYFPATWTRTDGLQPHSWCWFDTEITASWYPDGRRILIRQDRHAHTILHEADLTVRASAVLPTPPGSVLDAAVWPDGDVVYIWTDSLTPPQLRSGRDVRLPDSGAGPDPAASATVDDYQRQELWVPGPGGPIHVLLTTPNDDRRTRPAVFLVHGGPSQHARDAYDPLVEILASTGCAVVRANYRGSSGYGSAWRNDFSSGVGLTQVADLAAVRGHLVTEGLIEAGRVALWGTSWGGYLTLLALGVQPRLWRLGVAISPIADYAAAFHAASPAVQALDVMLFGGTPEQVPEAYARSSPASYVDQVTAPVLLAVSSDDVRCPPAPVERYAGLLAARRVPHQLVRRRAGHDDFDARSHLSLMQTVLLFMQRHFDGVQEEGTAVALAMARPVA
ncbi:prolyl oligopeptidase family serine peptidase [Solwaraspora sp. WMMA2065]|uniref:S9 family peptidase n=1 Tax=Solwaraspora sp. WMMA2065 TaxID=3015166 RepID=UPI00259B11EE|nr:prolyl oligopeptidase family serine peptidase [Solwaraspora sp. WMMA2065]WJK33375.1 prolyl oligopeptidase family serine peptidase [Solwaraspora sp. WMMA2065]